MVLCKKARHPEWNAAGGFELHEHESLREDRRAPSGFREREMILAAEDVLIERHAEVAPVAHEERLALIAEKDDGLEVLVVPAHVVDLRRDLVRLLHSPAPHPRFCLVLRQGHAALIHHILILFLELHEHGAGLRRGAVAAHAELLLVRRLFQTPADQPVGIRVVIEVADRRAPEAVERHVRRHNLQKRVPLPPREHVFHLIALKDRLICHFNHSFAVSGASISGQT